MRYILIVEYEVILLEQAVSFLKTLDLKMRMKVKFVLDLLSVKGNFLTEPYSKNITGHKNLKELRIRQGSKICRLFYFHGKGKVYIVVNGFIKKSRKTKPSEINKAIKLMNGYLEGNNE